MSKPICAVDGCQRSVSARGWCGMHYARWRAHKNPLMTLMPTRVNGTPAQRFYAKVAAPDTQSCCLWLGHTSKRGYGRFRLNGVYVNAHRASYILSIGPLSDELDLDHLCHTRDTACPGGVTCKHRRCVNPEHLEPVTHSENSKRRGDTASLRKTRTHCRNNHPLDAENVVMNQGKSRCKTCRRTSDRKYRLREL